MPAHAPSEHAVRATPTVTPQGVLAAVVTALLTVLLGAAALPGSATAATTPGPIPGQTYVSITFDDSNVSQRLAEESLRRNGLTGTFYTMVGWVNTPRFLTTADLTKFAADGMEIGGHTVTHPDLSSVAVEEATRQLCGDRAVLERWGFKPVSHAYPRGSATAAVRAAAQECGYASARGGGATFAMPGTCPECDHAQQPSPFDPYAVAAAQAVDATWTLDRLKASVTEVQATGGGWTLLSLHQICANYGGDDCPASQSLDPAIFDAFATWLADYSRNPANKVTVGTTDSVNRLYRGAGYPAYQPAKEVPQHTFAAGANRVANPGTQKTDPHSGLPACYQPGGWGDHERATKTTTGPSGDPAIELTVTNYVSGDAKIVTEQDAGTCAPAVTAGEKYTASVAYRSTAPTAMIVYTRDDTYHWNVWQVTPAYAASAGWTTATYTTPAIPAGVTGLAFGLALGSNGTLATDDYSLIEVGAPPTPQSTPVPAPAGSALANGSLETRDQAGPLPACYQASGWGTSSTSWAPVTPGATGASAMQLTMTGHKSGDAKLLTGFDAACAPVVTPGHTYTASTAYRASGPVTMVVYGRNAAGDWNVIADDAYPASATWRTALSTVRIPAGVTAVSFGPALGADGTMAVDDYTLTEQGASSNLVSNGALESVEESTTLPSCFQRGGWGTVTSRYAVAPGRTGNGIALTTTGWASGDAKLLPRMSGACVPEATGGRTYSTSIAYTSTQPVTLVVYRRDAAGAWSVWEEQPLPAAASWTTAARTTAAAPAGTTGITVGIAIAGNGTVTTDDYSIVENG